MSSSSDGRASDRVDDVLAAAQEDHESVVKLTAQLVELPSRGGVDPCGPVLEHLDGWLTESGLDPRVVEDETGPVGVVCELGGRHPGPRWVLDACVDTAPFGDESLWSYPPTAAVIDADWLWGRGAADSKVGAAMFCHIAARLAPISGLFKGRLVLLLDADEHSGRFGGARRYFAGDGAPDDVAGVMIGYPGMDELVVGSRGVWRASLTVHGVAAHSGGKTVSPNAVEKAAELVQALAAAGLPAAGSAEFPVEPKLTVTGIGGGQGYSTVPDLCDVHVDVRTTPTFGSQAARRTVADAARRIDGRWPGTLPTEVSVETSWPAYVLDDTEQLRTSLLETTEALGVTVRPKVSGPSNIGNYLATLGIPATAGFGVRYKGLHGTNERIDVSTIPTVQATYHTAVLNLLTSP